MPRVLEARQVATRIVKRLREKGFTAYFAGGCVRDELLGQHPTDYDVATDATPDDIRGLFNSTNEVGASFGVMLVHMFGRTVEVATFREEDEYTDRRRPDRVHYSDAPNDARRRDFTINALFLDPLAEPEDGAETAGFGRVDGVVIDYIGGVADLKAGIVRAVGDPEKRLSEDHLRALRAVRFAARLEFLLDPDTAAAVRRHATDLEGVSRERIGHELRKMLGHPTRAI
ncbi:MAG: CCA tRNA nucleotidyltransferase, partial [Planctomycetota bacterium]|nr:CCA tRNA nucleotidyltransferase [Planctomycetota bacterium]